MKIEDLKIGSWYTTNRRGEEIVVGQLVGFDKVHDPVLLPTEDSKQLVALYTSRSESRDPACKAGHFGLSLHIFLMYFYPVNMHNGHS